MELLALALASHQMTPWPQRAFFPGQLTMGKIQKSFSWRPRSELSENIDSFFTTFFSQLTWTLQSFSAYNHEAQDRRGMFAGNYVRLGCQLCYKLPKGIVLKIECPHHVGTRHSCETQRIILFYPKSLIFLPFGFQGHLGVTHLSAPHREHRIEWVPPRRRRTFGMS